MVERGSAARFELRLIALLLAVLVGVDQRREEVFAFGQELVVNAGEGPRAIASVADKGIEWPALAALESAAPPDDTSDASEAATRVLDLPEDKTAPPPVSPDLPRREQQAEQDSNPSPARSSTDGAEGLEPGMVLVRCNGIDIVDDASLSDAIATSNGVLKLELLASFDGDPIDATVRMTQLKRVEY